MLSHTTGEIVDRRQYIACHTAATEQGSSGGFGVDSKGKLAFVHIVGQAQDARVTGENDNGEGVYAHVCFTHAHVHHLEQRVRQLEEARTAQATLTEQHSSLQTAHARGGDGRNRK